MTTTNLKEEKQYTTNKIYIMINELKNATDIKDSKIFLIKYRNTLEEIRNMWYNSKQSKLNSRW